PFLSHPQFKRYIHIPMPRPRLPQQKAEVSGAIAKNAGRFKDRAVSGKTRPVGQPYATMTDYQRRAWGQLTSEAPWLNSSHRQMLRLACIVMAIIEEGKEEVGVQHITTLRAVLSSVGMTPIDETKGAHKEEEEKDEFDKMMGGGKPN